jgi:tRNA dimethylallyltransferase
LGYGPVLRYLAGEIDEAQARQQTVDDTRRFARRQQRWFGKDARIRWLDAGAPDLADEVASYVTAT